MANVYLITKVLGKNYQLQKESLQKCNKGEVFSKFAIFTQKWSKIAIKEKVDFGVLANHPAVHSGGVSRGRAHGCGCWH